MTEVAGAAAPLAPERRERPIIDGTSSQELAEYLAKLANIYRLLRIINHTDYVRDLQFLEHLVTEEIAARGDVELLEKPTIAPGAGGRQIL